MMLGGLRAPFVLVHGAGSGAWCWFKTVDRLQKAGQSVTTVDLAGCGIDTSSPENFSQYSRPLESLMSALPEDPKVVLVGHSAGGVSVAHASEHFPHKIAVAVYIAAPMRPTELRPTQPNNGDLELCHGKDSGKEPPKSFRFSDDYSLKTFYQLCPSEDFVLASMLDRPFPVGLTKTQFKITPERYGSVPRIYIKTLQDKAFAPELQDRFIAESPPKEVLTIDSDHSPFFSAPSELNKLLLHIAKSYIN